MALCAFCIGSFAPSKGGRAGRAGATLSLRGDPSTRFFRPRLLTFVLLGIVLTGCGRAAQKPLNADELYVKSVMAETYQWIRDYVSPATGLPYDKQDERAVAGGKSRRQSP